LDDRGSIDYECPDEPYSEGYCRFHNSEFAASEKNKAVLIELLNQKVKDANANTSGSPLKLIGYTFPKRFPMRYKFKSSVEFDRAHFLGEVDFNASVFEKDVSFYETEFNGEANFSNATFNGEARFNGTRFGGQANFDDTTFERDVFFHDATFPAGANFLDTTFEKDVSFSSATFGGETDFGGSRLNRVLSFTDNTVKGTIGFARVFFKEKDQIIFNGDLSKVSFVNTDVTRVRFGDVIWGKNQTKSGNNETEHNNTIISNTERFDFKIHDERVIEKDVKSTDIFTTNSLESVIAEYRNLRENYEYYLRYEEAGKFFMREMELRRNYNQPLSTSTEKIRKRNIFARNLGLIGLYHLVCDYGESIRKPLIIIIFAFISATIFFSYENGWSMENFDPVRKTLASFFPFFSLTDDPSLPEMILKATILPMVGLLFITLRRKLERRFRH
jgi:hypothetical protein